jgi:glycosyltransferase involved in cell wall biosynthesis
MAEVCVIVPSYNHAAFLEQRLKSIFNQTYQNFQVILLDDASTDDSVNILRQYAEKYADKIKYFIVNKTNGGSPFQQWKKGFDLSSEKYIWIAESDDWADERFLEGVINVFDRFANVGIVSCIPYKVDQFSNIIGSLKDWLSFLDYTLHKVYIENGRVFLTKYMLEKNNINNASGVVFKSELIRGLPDYYLKQRQSGDYVFWSCLLLHTDIGYIKDHLNYWRIHQSSVTAKNYQKSSIAMREHYNLIKFLKKWLSPNDFIEHHGSLDIFYYKVFKRWMRTRVENKRTSGFDWDDCKTLLTGMPLDKKLFFRLIKYTFFK